MTENIRVNETLSLTPFEAGDKPSLLRYLNDPVVYRNTLRVPYPYTDIAADEWLVHVRERREQIGREANWAIRHSEHGLIGGIGCFWKTGLEGHSDEIGYWLAKPWRGQGIMGSVVAVFSRWLFDTRPALVRLEAYVFAHNSASERVLEKAGYTKEGYLRKLHVKDGAYLDASVWAMIRE